MKRTLKLILVFLNMVCSITALALIRLIFIFSRRRIYYAYRTNHFFNRVFALILGIRAEVTGEKELLREKGIFFVSNHLSYIDGITISSLAPVVFIGKSDLKSWPLFGLLSTLSYTIFVDRISPANIHEEIARIESFLNQGLNIIMFPEGTSTDGGRLLPFKSSFFKVALDTESPLVPLAIKYTRINGQDLDEQNKDHVFWYGEMDFLPHFIKVLGLNSIELKIKVCGPIDVMRPADEPLSLQRKYLSDASREAIEQNLR